MNLKFIFGSFCLLFIWSACKKSSTDSHNFFIKQYEAYADSSSTNYYTFAVDIIESQNGYLILGKRNSGQHFGFVQNNCFLMEISTAGNLLWQKEYERMGSRPVRLLASPNKQSYYVLSNSLETTEDTFSASILTKIDAQGMEVNNIYLSPGHFVQAADIAITHTGNILVVGNTTYISPSKPVPNDSFSLLDTREIYFGTYDADLNLLSQKTWGGLGRDLAYKITPVGDSFWIGTVYNTYLPGAVPSCRIYKVAALDTSSQPNFIEVANYLSNTSTVYDMVVNPQDTLLWLMATNYNSHDVFGFNDIYGLRFVSGDLANKDQALFLTEKLYVDNGKLWVLTKYPTIMRFSQQALKNNGSNASQYATVEKQWRSRTGGGYFNRMLFLENGEVVFLGNFQLDNGIYVNTVIRTDKNLSSFCEQNLANCPKGS